jgi:hypothetical protein
MQNGLTSAVNSVESITDRLSYLMPRDRWFDFIVLNVHASKKTTFNVVKDSFYEEMERVFIHFQRHFEAYYWE